MILYRRKGRQKRRQRVRISMLREASQRETLEPSIDDDHAF